MNSSKMKSALGWYHETHTLILSATRRDSVWKDISPHTVCDISLLLVENLKK